VATIYRDEDADLGRLAGRTVAVLGYGNQGRSQALNLRDSGVGVVVGSPKDRSGAQAEEDGFEVLALGEAVARSEIVFLLVPDEVMAGVYDTYVAPNLAQGATLDFASAFNITHGRIVAPEEADVVLLAPRMIGSGVRETFLKGTGFPSLVGVGQDASGNAWETVLALARAIGSTRMGAVRSSFEEETLVDLFSEQCGALQTFKVFFEVLTEAGVDPDVAILELYGSGELSEVYGAARDLGLWGQLPLHSHTSQYGQQVVGPRYLDQEGLKASLREVVAHIRSGAFAEEWREEYAKGLPKLMAATDENLRHPMQLAENRLYERLGRRQSALGNWLAPPEDPGGD
jgi:ketol-acid reductoisomerase